MSAISNEYDVPLVRSRAVRRWPNAAPVLLGATMVSGIALFDWATGPHVSGSLLYVIAVVSVTWCGRLRTGVLVAVLAAAESLAVHVAASGWSVTAAGAWNASSRVIVLILVAVLLARLRAALLEARHFASIDPLTGALNRRAFQIWADRERLRSIRTGSTTSVVYMDLDDFKAVNDRLGHREGDRLLTSFAAAVAGAIRGTDLFARIGGDEFVVLLPDTDVRSAMRVADRMKRVSCSACDEDTITASVGIATFRTPPGTVDEMVDAADVQMYRAKGAGRGRISGVLVDAEERHLEESLVHDGAPLVDRIAG